MINKEQLLQTRNEHFEHISEVQKRLLHIAKLLMDRALAHDATKLEKPELSGFAEVAHKLRGITFGSPEYKQLLAELKPTLDHHYGHNGHHPEHWKNGINDMSLIDLIEMLVDWKSASLRHNDGNINKSIDYNSQRYNIDSQLTNILRNSLKDIL